MGWSISGGEITVTAELTIAEAIELAETLKSALSAGERPRVLLTGLAELDLAGAQVLLAARRAGVAVAGTAYGAAAELLDWLGVLRGERG